MESILNSIKKLLGPGANDTHFDPDIIIHINSVFSDLHQLGVGPAEGFYIEDDTSSWSEFISDTLKIESVKTYMYLRVKLLFDPPLNSSVIKAMQEEIKKLEWRLNVAADNTANKN